MKKLIVLCFALPVLYAQELEVEGNLKVTGEIDAQGNPITNVGNPTQDNDAVNLSTVRDMSGMKPERIYSYTAQFESLSVTVPEDKVWLVNYICLHDYSKLFINGTERSVYHGDNGAFWLLPNTLLSCDPGKFIFSIYEYLISASGTDQGLDYIKP